MDPMVYKDGAEIEDRNDEQNSDYLPGLYTGDSGIRNLVVTSRVNQPPLQAVVYPLRVYQRRKRHTLVHAFTVPFRICVLLQSETP